MNDLYNMLNNIRQVCDNHGVIFEVNSMGVIIRKYFYHNGKPYKFNQSFSFDMFKHVNIDWCITEFERKLRLYKGDLK